MHNLKIVTSLVEIQTQYFSYTNLELYPYTKCFISVNMDPYFMYVCVCVCTYVCVCVCVCVYIYIYIHTHTCSIYIFTYWDRKMLENKLYLGNQLNLHHKLVTQ
jgi:hypothetical protein